MRFPYALIVAGLLGASTLLADTPDASGVPPEVAQQLEALPASHVPLRNATLGSAIRLLAADAHLSYLAPPEADFSERISSDVTMNPYELLMILSQDYGFGVQYRRGLWRFYRLDDNELITKAYPLRFNNLSKVSIGSSNLNSQLAAATGGSSGSGSGGGHPSSSLGQGGSFETKPSRVIEDVKKILSVPTGAIATTALAARPGAARKLFAAPIVEPIWDADSSELFVVATRQQHALIADYLKTVDRPQKLIRISVKFVETQRNPTQNLGVDWANTLLGSGGPVSLSGVPPGTISAISGATGSSASTAASGGIASGLQIQRLITPGAGLPVTLLSAPAFQWTVQAIASDKRSSIVQDPVIFTANNHEVTFKATSELPIQQGSTTFGSATAATSSQIAYLEVGTQLTVLPNLMPGTGRGSEIVQCNFSINVSSVIGQQSIGGNPYPITSNRSYSYSVPIPNGRTLVIAGLEERTRQLSDSKVPLFGDIPVLGYAFKNRSDQVTHTTLMAFITPELIDEPSANDVAVLALPPLRHRPFQGSSSETLAEISRSLDGLAADIDTLQTCANGRNKEAVLNRLDRIGIELSLMDVRLGELKLENDKITALPTNEVSRDREQLSRAHDQVMQVKSD